MTLIAGLKSTGGIVLCADTEESNGIAKYSTEKLDMYVRDWCRVGFAGAGNYGDLIDTVVDCLKERLDRDKPKTFKAAKHSLSEELNRLHDNELRLFPTSKPEDKIVELLIAVRPRDEEHADLWASTATALHPVRSGYVVRGIGDVLGFVAKRTLNEVSADKAYLSGENLLTTLRHKAIPYIPFKINSKAQTNYGPKSTLWTRMLSFYNDNREEFLTHYHKRSNVETTFHMIKSKFGQRLRSKTMIAQINEALCKVLCHNLCVVIQSIHELGIEVDFSQTQAA